MDGSHSSTLFSSLVASLLVAVEAVFVLAAGAAVVALVAGAAVVALVAGVAVVGLVAAAVVAVLAATFSEACFSGFSFTQDLLVDFS